MEPISLSTNGFCHGDRGAVTDFLNAYVLNSSLELMAIDAIAITKQESRCLIKWKRFDDLLGRPLGRRIRCDVEVHDETPIMPKQNETEQDAKRRGRYRKEIDCHDIANVVVQESPPCLRRRLVMAELVLVHSCLRRLVAKEPQLRLDSRATCVESGCGSPRRSSVGRASWIATSIASTA